MDQPKIERLLRLMKLMSGKEDYTVNQLAEKMDTSYRSIYRYIDTFKDCGFVVVKKQGNIHKIGKMPKKLIDLKDLSYFTEEEAYILDSVPFPVRGSLHPHFLFLLTIAVPFRKLSPSS